MTTKQDREEARERLLNLLKPGDTVHCILRHVSRSGMSRGIDLYKMECDGSGEPVAHWLSAYAAKLSPAGATFDRNRECLKVTGCGMDMGFAVVYDLARILWPEGFACLGDGCPANDHVNPPHPKREAGSMTHHDSGCALKHRWL